jgi:hypothetical protein
MTFICCLSFLRKVHPWERCLIIICQILKTGLCPKLQKTHKMYVNIDTEMRFNFCALRSQIFTATNPLGGKTLVFIDYSRYFVTVYLPYSNYLVCRARPGGAKLSLFFSCISWKRRDIIVNVIGSLRKVPVCFVCFQIKFNMFDILINSAPHKISQTCI